MRVVSKSKIKDYKAMIRISLIGFLAELPNFILTLISAFISNTPVVWVDTINSLAETLHCLLIFLVTLKLQKNNEEKYNYGVDRVETFASFVCDCLIIIGMISVGVGAVIGIVNPSLPSDHLLSFVIIKASNIFWDGVFVISAVKAAKKAESRLGYSEVRNYIKALISDIVVGIVAVITYFFRGSNWVCYANPIASIILVIIFIIIYIKKIKELVNELVDKSISIPDQDKIFDIILQNHNIVKKIEQVNCRRLSSKTYIDVCLIMNDDVTYKDQIEYLELIRNQINKIIPGSIVKLVIGQTELITNKEG